MFVRDLPHEIFGDITGDDAGERRIAGERTPAKKTPDRLFGHQLAGRIGGVNGPERRVVAWPQKRERRCQRAGADAGHDFELRTVAARGPADQQSGAECAVGASAGNGEEADHRPPALLQELGPVGPHLRPFLRGKRAHVVRSAVTPEANFGPFKNGGLVGIGRRHRIARQRGAAGEAEGCQERKPRTPQTQPTHTPAPLSPVQVR
jgi:hypothetical protein